MEKEGEVLVLVHVDACMRMHARLFNCVLYICAFGICVLELNKASRYLHEVRHETLR